MLNIFKIIILVVIAIGIIYVSYMTLSVYSPKEKEELTIYGDGKEKIKTDKCFKLITFNIGYCGLDKGQDFFWDGGTMSRSSSKEQTIVNLNNITNFLISEHPDFIFLQEVDTKSTRSFNINEVEIFRKTISDYQSAFAIDHKVNWVPYPLKRPLGSTKAGLMTFSKYKVNSSIRFSLPGKGKWPKKIFDLDKCFLESRIMVENNKELVIINTHLTAFDKGARVRERQLFMLKMHIIKEYKLGNYVLVGGDWNYSLPDTNPYAFKSKESWPYWLYKMPDSFKPNHYSWGVNNEYYTVRTNSKPYIEGENFTAIIDGFLVSDNIEIVRVYNHRLEFENSDHNPVEIIFKLKPTA